MTALAITALAITATGYLTAITLYARRRALPPRRRDPHW